MRGTTQAESSTEADAGRKLAGLWGLSYREGHTITVDPGAREIVSRADARRLEAFPLELGRDGPVFAVAEPSENRFAAVRSRAGTNASFVVVSRATLRTLLDSKEVIAQATSRRPLLFHNRSGADATREPPQDAAGEADDPGTTVVGLPVLRAAPVADRPRERSEQDAAGSGPAQALESLLNSITASASDLKAQVAELTDSLETSQRELRRAREELAEVQQTSEGHDDLVVALSTEVEQLRRELEDTRSMHSSITARMQELAHALAHSD